MGNQRVNGAQQPEGDAAQGHSEDTLGRGEPGWAVNHHFSVSKGVGYTRQEDQRQRFQRAGGFHMIQMRQLEQEDPDQNDRRKQQILYRDFSAEQRRQPATMVICQVAATNQDSP